MSVKFNLHTPLNADLVERDFRHDLPGLKVSRGIFGSIRILVKVDILVCMSISKNKVHIFGTCPLLYAMLSGTGSHGFHDDEKKHYAGIYAEWFEIRYRNHIVTE